MIVPRWEWRTFGDDFGAADRWFAAATPERVQESDETYLLSLESDAFSRAGSRLSASHSIVGATSAWPRTSQVPSPSSRSSTTRGGRRNRASPTGARRPTCSIALRASSGSDVSTSML